MDKNKVLGFSNFSFSSGVGRAFGALSVRNEIPRTIMVRDESDRGTVGLTIFLSVCTIYARPMGPYNRYRRYRGTGGGTRTSVGCIRLPGSEGRGSVRRVERVVNSSIVGPGRTGTGICVFPFTSAELSSVIRGSFLGLLRRPPRGMCFVVLYRGSGGLLPAVLSHSDMFHLGAGSIFDRSTITNTGGVMGKVLSAQRCGLVRTLCTLDSGGLTSRVLLIMGLVLHSKVTGDIKTSTIFSRRYTKRLTEQFAQTGLVSVVRLARGTGLGVPGRVGVGLLAA